MKYSKNKLSVHSDSGFTIVEILVIVLIIGVLMTILLLTYSGVQSRQRNTTRINDIKLVQSNLETYYAQSGFYPTLADLNNPTWTSKNLKIIDQSELQDPSSKAGSVRFADAPTTNQFAYQPTAANGISPCDNKTVACAKYTLTATLEGNSGTFVQKSLN
jgi:type II secretory pathway pseudopilin PulG